MIPQPRCINGVKANLSQNKYKNALDAFQDLNLVFLNALYYNQEGSQIAKDAATLKVSIYAPRTHRSFQHIVAKGILENEWRARSVLPPPPPSPTTSAPQDAQPKKEPKERAAATAAPVRSHSSAKLQPAPAAPPRAHVNPTPSTSSQVKEVVKQKSPERSASPDMDVDIGGTPEPELTGHDAARDGESEEIVRQLEKSLPRWEGFDDVGWAEDITPVSTRAYSQRSFRQASVRLPRR